MSATDKRKEAMVGQMPRELWSSIVHLSIATSCKYAKNQIKFLQIKKKSITFAATFGFSQDSSRSKSFQTMDLRPVRKQKDRFGSSVG